MNEVPKALQKERLEFPRCAYPMPVQTLHGEYKQHFLLAHTPNIPSQKTACTYIFLGEPSHIKIPFLHEA